MTVESPKDNANYLFNWQLLFSDNKKLEKDDSPPDYPHTEVHCQRANADRRRRMKRNMGIFCILLLLGSLAAYKVWPKSPDSSSPRTTRSKSTLPPNIKIIDYNRVVSPEPKASLLNVPINSYISPPRRGGMGGGYYRAPPTTKPPLITKECSPPKQPEEKSNNNAAISPLKPETIQPPPPCQEIVPYWNDLKSLPGTDPLQERFEKCQFHGKFKIPDSISPNSVKLMDPSKSRQIPQYHSSSYEGQTHLVKLYPVGVPVISITFIFPLLEYKYQDDLREYGGQIQLLWQFNDAIEFAPQDQSKLLACATLHAQATLGIGGIGEIRRKFPFELGSENGKEMDILQLFIDLDCYHFHDLTRPHTNLFEPSFTGTETIATGGDQATLSSSIHNWIKSVEMIPTRIDRGPHLLSPQQQCSNQGALINGVCICQNPYSGENCSKILTIVKPPSSLMRHLSKFDLKGKPVDFLTPYDMMPFYRPFDPITPNYQIYLKNEKIHAVLPAKLPQLYFLTQEIKWHYEPQSSFKKTVLSKGQNITKIVVSDRQISLLLPDGKQIPEEGQVDKFEGLITVGNLKPSTVISKTIASDTSILILPHPQLTLLLQK